MGMGLRLATPGAAGAPLSYGYERELTNHEPTPPPLAGLKLLYKALMLLKYFQMEIEFGLINR